MKVYYHRSLNMRQLVALSEYLTKFDVSFEKLAAADPKLEDDWKTIGNARAIVNRLIKEQLDVNPNEGEGPDKWAASILNGKK